MTQDANRRSPDRSPDPLRRRPAPVTWSESDAATTPWPPVQSAPPPRPRRSGAILRVVGGVLLALILVAAGLLGARYFLSGPAAADNSDATTQTYEIARTFATSGDAAAARLALAALPVANDEQWLLFTTEQALADPAVDDSTRRGLVALALELGLSEAGIRAYAESAGLVATAADESATVAAAINAPVAAQPAPEASSSADRAEPAAAASPAVSAAVTSTAATTGTAAFTGTALAGAAQSATPAAAAAAPAAAATTAPTATPAAAALTASTTELINLRSGPGTEYALAGGLNAGESVELLARTAAGDWLQVKLASGATAWVFSELVTASGSTSTLAVATDIPAAPATATPAPVAAAPTAAPAAPTAAPAAPAAPAEPPTATPAPAPAANPGDTPTFRLVARRLWGKEENGTCQGQHLLRINVIDAAGNPINGVLLRGVYTGFEATTGDQGKGDGRIEFDLYGSGEAFKVVRNNDGRDAVSDEAGGFTTRSLDIDIPTLIGAGYCSSEADCQVFYNSFGCTGHHSWEATFQRNY